MAHPNARQTQFQQKHYFRKTFNWNDTGIGAGVYIGTLPAGAMVTSTDVLIVTAFNAGTTNVPVAGTNASSYNNLMTAPTNTAGTQASQLPTGTALGPLSADSDIYVMFTQTGTAATAGQAVIVVNYAPNNDN